MCKAILSTLLAVYLGLALGLGQAAAVGLEKEPTREEIYQKLRREYDKKVDSAMDVQLRLLEYTESKFGLNSPESIEYVEAIAWMLMEQQDFRDANFFYRRANKIRIERLPPSPDNDKQLSVNYFYLADTYLYRGKYMEAIQNYEESMRKTSEPGHAGDALTRKGFALEGLKEYEQAEEVYLEALRRYDAATALNPEHSKLYEKRVNVIYKRLPELYHILGKNRKVKEYQDLIKERRKQKLKEEKEASEKLSN